MRNITETLMKPLEKFRKDHLGTIRVMHCLLSIDGGFVSLAYLDNYFDFFQRREMSIDVHVLLSFSFRPT